jgi:hypothetical protein
MGIKRVGSESSAKQEDKHVATGDRSLRLPMLENGSHVLCYIRFLPSEGVPDRISDLSQQAANFFVGNWVAFLSAILSATPSRFSVSGSVGGFQFFERETVSEREQNRTQTLSRM